MSWSDQDRAAVELLLTNTWRQDFPPTTVAVYLHELRDYEPADVITAIRTLQRDPAFRVFPPGLAAITQQLEADTEAPMEFAVAWRRLWRAIKRAQPRLVPVESARAIEVAGAEHPLLGAYVQAVSWPVLFFTDESNTYAMDQRRKAWDDLVANYTERRAHGKAIEAMSRRGELKRVDPVAALGGGSE